MEDAINLWCQSIAYNIKQEILRKMGRQLRQNY